MTEGVPVVLQGVTWSREHAHPLLLLRALETDITFAVVADVDEARALATCSCTRARTRRRLAVLVADLLRALGATVHGIELRVDEQGTLSGTLRLTCRGGIHAFQLAGSDALLLAEELGVLPTMQVSQLLALGRTIPETRAPLAEPYELLREVEQLLRDLEGQSDLDGQFGRSE